MTMNAGLTAPSKAEKPRAVNKGDQWAFMPGPAWSYLHEQSHFICTKKPGGLMSFLHFYG